MYNPLPQLSPESPFSSRTDILPRFFFHSLPLLQLCAFCPFTEKPDKETKHLDSERSQKRTGSRNLISTDYDQRLKLYCSNPGSFIWFLLVLSWLQGCHFSLLLWCVLTLSAPLLTSLHTNVFPLRLAFWQQDQRWSCFCIFLRFSINHTHKQTLNHIDVFNTPVSTHNDIHHFFVHVSDPHNSQLNWNPKKIW